MIVAAISGVIMTPTIVAMRAHLWAGYLVVAAMFSIFIGPFFVVVDPPVLHYYAFAAAIIVGEGQGLGSRVVGL